MVAAATTDASQFTGLVAAQATAPETQVSQMTALAAGAYPSQFADVSQFGALLATQPNVDVRVSQFTALVAAIGRVQEPQVRAWTFSLDGHDYYVLRLGATETLIYDTFAKQWYVWGSGDGDVWRAFSGCNWQGGNLWAESYGSSVIVGDDGNGSLYFLDTENPDDDDALQGSAVPRPYERVITGQVATRSSDSIPCYGVSLIGSIGETLEASIGTVTLFTSDDTGHTYDEHDTITVDPGDYQARVEWWSLGSFSAPGRLFQVVDYGILQRIDYLDMLEPPEKGQ